MHDERSLPNRSGHTANVFRVSEKQASLIINPSTLERQFEPDAIARYGCNGILLGCSV